MPMKSRRFKTVDEYISGFPKGTQRILEQMRRTIKSAVPGAQETISYQIPTFKMKGTTIAHFAAFKEHIGFYPPAPKAFTEEVSRYAGPRGNLKFPIDEPMPLELVKRIVKYRARQLVE
jgi:uncharacterized protein YdhG (YjbR/CyaY superfamily)